jgi:hypothetical protein
MLTVSLLLLAASACKAQVDGCESHVSQTCAPLKINVCPAGDYEPISNGCGTGADLIEIWARDASGAGIAGIPVTDYWLGACDPSQNLCLNANPIIADAPTDASGYAAFSGPIGTGGCVSEGGIYISIQGVTILEKPLCSDPICLDVLLLSPDLNVDCAINLSDMAYFGIAYNKRAGDPGYNPCCDFNDDDEVNLSDFAYF